MPKTTGNRSTRGKPAGAMDVGEEEDEFSGITIVDAQTGEPIDENTPVPDPEDVALEGDEPPAPAENEAFEILKREKAAADRELAAERQRNQELTARVSTNAADLDATNAAVLKHAAAAARGEVDAAKAAYAAARAAGDVAAEAEAQATIAEKVAEAREYEAASVEFERSLTERRATPAKATPAAAPASNDPVEAIASQMTPKSADWLRRHKSVAFKSQAAWSRTIAAHHGAVEAGHEIDTPEYFAFLEGELKITGGDPEPTPAARTTTKPAPKRAPPMAAAPVSKGTTTSGAATVTLSAAERAMAKRLGMTAAKYGGLKHKAQKMAEDPDYRGPRYSHQNPAIAQQRGAR